MRNIYVILLNMLIFFFLVGVLNPAIGVTGNNSVVSKILVGLLFGVFMMLIPNVLKFLKLPVNGGSMLLMGIIVSFLFYFLSIYLFQLIIVQAANINLGIPLVGPIVLGDRTVALVFLSLVSAVLSIGLDAIGKKK